MRFVRLDGVSFDLHEDHRQVIMRLGDGSFLDGATCTHPKHIYPGPMCNEVDGLHPMRPQSRLDMLTNPLLGNDE